MHLLRALALAGPSVALGLGVYHAASLQGQPLRRTGVRGLSRVRAMRRKPVFRSIEPLLRWAAGRVHGFVPARVLAKLDRALAQAGDPLGLEPSELVATSVVGGALGVSLGVVYALLGSGSRSLLLSTLLGALLAAYPWLWVDKLRTERKRAVARSLNPAVDLLCLGLSAGLDLPSAVRQVVEKSGQKDGPLIQEMSIALHELSLGKTRREALEMFAERNASPSVREFVAAIVQAEEEGQPLSEVLRTQAAISRQRRSVEAEEASSRAALRLMIPMVLLFVGVFGLILGPLVLSLAKELR